MGLLDSITEFFTGPGGAPPSFDPGGTYEADPTQSASSGFWDTLTNLGQDLGQVGDALSLPSELGGTLADWTGGWEFPSVITDLGSDPFGGGGYGALNTQVPLTLGGGMGDLLPVDFGDVGTQGALARRIPWGSIMAVLGAATRLYGAQMLPAVLAALSGRFGIPSGTILFRFLKKKGRRRSARGITGRQLAITRRTMRKVNSMYSLLHRGAGYSRRAPAPFRRRARRR